jgi:hypothetical protein
VGCALHLVFSDHNAVRNHSLAQDKDWILVSHIGHCPMGLRIICFVNRYAFIKDAEQLIQPDAVNSGVRRA